MISSDERALVAMRATLANYLAMIDANWRADDEETLHDLRVAIRRTRALLANAKGVIAEPDRARFADGFRRLARATTAARDLDVLVVDWPRVVALAPAADARALGAAYDALCQRRDVAHAQVAAALAARETCEFVDTWRGWLAAPPDFGAPHAKQRSAKVVRRRAHKSRKRLRRLARLDTPEARHAFRKEAKRLRYLAEAFPKSFRRNLVPALTHAQDVLGRERDRFVQAAILDELGAGEVAEAIRQQPPAADPRRKASRSLKRWIHAA